MSTGLPAIFSDLSKLDSDPEDGEMSLFDSEVGISYGSDI